MELGDDYVLDLQSKMASRWSSTKLLWSSTKLIWSSTSCSGALLSCSGAPC